MTTDTKLIELMAGYRAARAASEQAKADGRPEMEALRLLNAEKSAGGRLLNYVFQNGISLSVSILSTHIESAPMWNRRIIPPPSRLKGIVTRRRL